MLKNFWYAVETSDQVTNKPKKITCLGQDFVLYRTSKGEVVCLSDLCPHRGAALSGGWVKDDKMVCPYHGWEFVPDGACVRIPANLEGRGMPKKARVDSYPTQEKYGFVWVFMGDLAEEDRPPIPHWPEFDDLKKDGGRWKPVYGEYLWNSNYERILENGCDVAHTPFVHAGRFGNPERPEVEEYEVEMPDEWSAFATVRLYPPQAKGLWGRLSGKTKDLKDRPPVETTAGWMLPNMIKLHVRLPMGNIIIYDSNIPIDETTTLVKFVGLRDFFTGDWADKNALKRIYGIFAQDVPVVDGTRPELLPADLAAELHVKSDLIAVHYRRRRQELADKGWMLGDEDRIMGDVPRREATVIPSPARKNNPELARAWVHKARGEHPRVDDSILKGEAERAAAQAAEAAETTETAADDKESQA